MTSHAQAPDPQPPASPRSRGRWTIIVGSVVMGLAAVTMIVSTVMFGSTSPGKFQRVSVSGRSGTITFSAVGDYVAYYESSSISKMADQPENVTAVSVPLIPVRLTNESTGQQLVVDRPYGNRPDGKPARLHYDYQGRAALAIWQFRIGQPGSYRVELGTTSHAADPGAVVAFGPSIAGLLTGGLVLLLGGFLFFVGLVILTIGLVVRRRARSRPLTGR